ncbi:MULTISPECIES: hypothetical protein [Neisseria]|nr:MULTISPECIES: hypothetical protein [Neisseria]
MFARNGGFAIVGHQELHSPAVSLGMLNNHQIPKRAFRQKPKV